MFMTLMDTLAWIFVGFVALLAIGLFVEFLKKAWPGIVLTIVLFYLGYFYVNDLAPSIAKNYHIPFTDNDIDATLLLIFVPGLILFSSILALIAYFNKLESGKANALYEYSLD
jgi:hypothetical protein